MAQSILSETEHAFTSADRRWRTGSRPQFWCGWGPALRPPATGARRTRDCDATRLRGSAGSHNRLAAGLASSAGLKRVATGSPAIDEAKASCSSAAIDARKVLGTSVQVATGRGFLPVRVILRESTSSPLNVLRCWKSPAVRPPPVGCPRHRSEVHTRRASRPSRDRVRGFQAPTVRQVSSARLGTWRGSTPPASRARSGRPGRSASSRFRNAACRATATTST